MDKQPLVHVVDKNGLRILTLKQLFLTAFPRMESREYDMLATMYTEEERIELIAGQVRLISTNYARLERANKRLTKKLNALLQGKLFQEGEEI